MVLLQEVAIGNISFWMLIGYTSVMLGIIATIAGFIKAFSTKANKDEFNKLCEKVEKKAEQDDVDEMKAIIQQLQIRHEQINTEVILEISKQIMALDKKFDTKFDNMTKQVIGIISNQKK